jgi:anti-sigma regulatory factor (Ser/Thr protein kinase)
MAASVVNPIAELSIPANTEEVRRASAWLELTCLERGVPPDEISRLDLCLNEALANVIGHGGTSIRAFPIRLHVDVHRNQTNSEAIVTVSDSGAPFNPLANPPKSRPKTLAEAEPGGLGILMIRKLSDNQSYRYSNGNNQLIFSVRWPKVQQ